MKEIELSQGYVALVDDEDFERCMASPKWYAAVVRFKDGSVRNVYAQCRVQKPNGKYTTQQIHRFIMDAKGIDHWDHNGLNNQRYNLRIATIPQNGWNQGLSKVNVSGYKGVYWRKDIGKWVAQIEVNGKRIWLGAFVNVVDAANAYDVAALKYYGEFALTNKAMAANA